MQSEYQTSAQLDNARVVSGCRPAELAVVQVGVHALEVHPVQDIEELEAKLQVYALGDPVVLNHAPVDVDEARVSELAALFVALVSRSGCRQVRSRENAIDVLLPVEGD